MICPRSHKKLISVETEIEPTLYDSPKGLGTNVPIFSYIFLFLSLLCLTFQAVYFYILSLLILRSFTESQ